MGKYVKFYDFFEESKIRIQGKDSYYVHFSIFESILNLLINNGYEILGYDGIIINKGGTLGPLSLIFDFSRKNQSVEERNRGAIKNIDNLYNQAKKDGYNVDDLYVDVIFKEV